MLTNQVKVKDYKNIIFDLGGVIINLDESRTISAFAAISKLPYTSVENSILHSEYYKKYEKGLLDDDQFRTAIRKEFQIEATDQQIDECMNAMLLDIPVERIELLKSLRSSFRLFLLSNTNNIHLNKFNSIFKQNIGGEYIDECFDKAYYSHRVNMRKPDMEIYQLIINENDLDPIGTLFLDDNESNLKGAQALGINTFHIKNPSQLFELFS